jgi:hypothetical protein
MVNEIIVALGDWAVATDGVQWILQRRIKAGWRPVSFVRSIKVILARCMREKDVEPGVARKLLASLPDYFDPVFDESRHPAHPDVPDQQPYRNRVRPEKRQDAASSGVIAGPIGEYSPWSLRAARMPLHPDLVAHLREANDWDRIRQEIAWSIRRPPPQQQPDAVWSDWKPCNPAKPLADDLSIPAFLRRR